ncbi:MAG: riboflavin synthase [Saprospiraceae bacterium]|nr:riboflavin synthase [Saprospiraceae bacterium]
MFAGIIEATGKIKKLSREGSNLNLTIHSHLAPELHIDQSIAHNGVCLTVVELTEEDYTVTAVQETLDKSNLNALQEGSLVNLERCIKPDSRIDGHYVQGHVDSVGKCLDVEELDGSWYYTFSFPEKYAHLIVDKGSIAINGVSLTVIDPTINSFKVTIIPYTYENTNFQEIEFGDEINLEFDILGKYVARSMEVFNSAKVGALA